MDTLLACKKGLVAGGVEVRGPTDRSVCQSIHFFDPSGHRLELAIDTTTPGMLAQLRDRAPAPWRNGRAPDARRTLTRCTPSRKISWTDRRWRSWMRPSSRSLATRQCGGGKPAQPSARLGSLFPAKGPAITEDEIEYRLYYLQSLEIVRAMTDGVITDAAAADVGR